MNTPTPPPFTLSLTPASQPIAAGQTVIVTGTITRAPNYTAPITIAASASAGLTTNIPQSGDSFTLSITCAATTTVSADGVVIMVTGTAGTASSTASCQVVGPVRYNQLIADQGHDDQGNAWVLINLYDTRTNVYQLDSSGKPVLDPVTNKPIPLSPLPTPLVAPFRIDGLLTDDPQTVWFPKVNKASLKALEAAVALVAARDALTPYLGILVPVQGLP